MNFKDKIGNSIGSIDKNGNYHDKIGNTTGKMGSDGRVTDKIGNSVGRVDSDGTVKDKIGNSCGKICSDGRVCDKIGNTIGYVKDGKVKDKIGNSIGSYSGDAKSAEINFAALPMDNRPLLENDPLAEEKDQNFTLQLDTQPQIKKVQVHDRNEVSINEIDASDFKAAASPYISDPRISSNSNISIPAELEEIEDEIADYFWYNIMVWLVWLVHLFNLGYFVFTTLVDIIGDSLGANGVLYAVWNLIAVFVWWKAFQAKDKYDFKVQRYVIAAVSLLIGFSITAFLTWPFSDSLITFLYVAANGVSAAVFNSNGLNSIGLGLMIGIELVLPLILVLKMRNLLVLMKKRSDTLPKYKLPIN